METKTANKIAKIPQKTKSLMDKTADLVSAFFGSWWAVFFHIVWFSLWPALNLDVNLLTFAVSLEAIFICILLLMAANKAEKERDLRVTKQRKRDKELIAHDIKLDEKADRQITIIKQLQKETLEEVKKIKKDLQKLQK